MLSPPSVKGVLFQNPILPLKEPLKAPINPKREPSPPGPPGLRPGRAEKLARDQVFKKLLPQAERGPR